MATLARGEIWTTYQCDGGTREAVFALEDLVQGNATERVTREDTLALVLPKDAAASAALALGRVLRLTYDDGTFDEWRIHELADQSGREGGRWRVTCRSVLYELRDVAILTSTSGTTVSLARTFDGLDASAIVDLLLPLLPAWWAKGTVTPTVVVSFSVTEATPLAVLRTLVEACAAAGQSCELTVRRNGTTGYYLDLVTAIGSGATVPDVRTAKNILTSERLRSREPLITRIYPTIGGTPALPYAYLRVDSVAGSDIELRQAETDAPVVAFNDQFNGWYLENDAGTRTQITDSVASTSVVTVASAAGYVAGAWCRLVADSAGTDLVYVANPTAATKVGMYPVSGDLVTNLVNNPFLSRWPGSTSAPPPGWSSSAGIVSRNANPTFIRRGLYSMRLQYSAPGIIARTDLVTPAPGRGSTYSAKFTAFIATGGLQVQLRNQVNTALATITVGTGWQEIEFTGIAIAGATGLYLNCSNGTVGSDTYVDSAQITWGAAQAAWTQGSTPSIALTRANMELLTNATDPMTYTLTLADLQRWAPADWPYDELTLGATLSITDTELGVTTTSRIQEITRDLRNPLRTTLVLERQTRTLTTVLAGQR